MGQKDRAAVIEEEQKAVDHAYRCFEQRKRRTEHLSKNLAGASTKDNVAQSEEFQRKLESYDDMNTNQLVFMRVDTEEEPGEHETLYIGRRNVRDEERKLVVISWTTDAATRWRLAKQKEPGAVRLRRRIACEERRVTGYFDEINLLPAHPAAVAPDGKPSPITMAAMVGTQKANQPETIDPFLLEELDRARDGLMRDIVETIQRDQLELVSDDRPGTLIIQGGPGTGKTAVGLHRVTWLLDNGKFTADQILVVGPHQGFLDYVSRVLPVLGTRGVATRKLRSLWEGETPGTDTEEQRRIKSDIRMAQVLERAVENTVRPSSLTKFLTAGGFQLLFEGTTLTVSEEEISGFHDRAREAGGPQQAQRERFANALVDRLLEEAVELRGNRRRDRRLRARISGHSRLSSLINAMWPRVSETRLLRRLFNDPDVLREAAEGILSDEEQQALIRPKAKRSGDELWTEDDLPCLEELSFLLSGVDIQRYRHIVVDEAQDLTPMQVRSLARRCPSGSMTVLGDLAQSTGAHRYGDWSAFTDLLTLPDGWRIEELTTGYRVPREVMEFAKPVAAAVAPATRFPDSIRPLGPESVRVIPAAPEQRHAEIEERVRDIIGTGEQSRSVAVILPEDADLLSETRARLLAEFSEQPEESAQASEKTPAVQVLAASQANGLEFDHLVVVEPASIAGAHAANLGRLYVALTRCTQSLTVVHSLPLPEELGGPSALKKPVEPIAASEADSQPVPAPSDTSAMTEPEPSVLTANQSNAITQEGLLPFLEAAAHKDRNSAHEGLRHTLLADLFRAGQTPDYLSKIADITCAGPAGAALYEVMGEGQHTYASMREGAIRTLEIRYATKASIDHVFLVLPQPPAEPWAADVIFQVFGVFVIWWDEDRWEGQQTALALGGGT